MITFCLTERYQQRGYWILLSDWLKVIEKCIFDPRPMLLTQIQIAAKF